jgi:hypothetical protein
VKAYVLASLNLLQFKITVNSWFGQLVSRLTTDAWVQYQASSCEICGEQSDSGTGFSPCTSVFPCQYHSIIAPYSFIHLPHTLYNVSLPVLQFSPVSIIPLLLHTHLDLKDTIIIKPNVRILGTFIRTNAVLVIRVTGTKITVTFSGFNLPHSICAFYVIPTKHWYYFRTHDETPFCLKIDALGCSQDCFSLFTCCV